MEALVVVLVLAGAAYLALSVYLLVLAVGTLKAHRTAMHALTARLEAERRAGVQHPSGGAR